MREERNDLLSSLISHQLHIGGGERVRTDDPLRARQVLSQLSYTPNKGLVGLDGLEPSTSRLSVVCSSQLSYKPLGRIRDCKASASIENHVHKL